jgi:tetratricopeptide (TPR) repeat protein
MYGDFLGTVGRINESLPLYEQTRRLAPLRNESYVGLGRYYLDKGRLNKVREIIDLGKSLSDGRGGLLQALGWSLAREEGGNKAFAEAALEELQRMIDSEIVKMNIRMQELLLMDDVEAARAALKTEIDNARGSERPSTMAIYAVYLGDYDLAFDALEISTQPLIFRSYFAELRPLPRFKELVRSRGLVDYWRETGNWPDDCRPLEGNDDFECF